MFSKASIFAILAIHCFMGLAVVQAQAPPAQPASNNQNYQYGSRGSPPPLPPIQTSTAAPPAPNVNQQLAQYYTLILAGGGEAARNLLNNVNLDTLKNYVDSNILNKALGELYSSGVVSTTAAPVVPAVPATPAIPAVPSAPAEPAPAAATLPALVQPSHPPTQQEFNQYQLKTVLNILKQNPDVAYYIQSLLVGLQQPVQPPQPAYYPQGYYYGPQRDNRDYLFRVLQSLTDVGARVVDNGLQWGTNTLNNGIRYGSDVFRGGNNLIRTTFKDGEEKVADSFNSIKGGFDTAFKFGAY